MLNSLKSFVKDFSKDSFMDLIKWSIPAISGLGGGWFLENWIIAVAIAVFVGFIIWLLFFYFRKKTQSESNPFTREKERKLLVSKITTGHSAAIIGIFGSERTELLNSLRDPNHYGHETENFIFSYMDISGLEVDCTQELFWKKALKPLGEKVSTIINDHNKLVVSAYIKCQEKDFNQDCLEKLFQEVKQANLRVVLLLDRFHDILNKQNLNQKTFLGKLRSLSSSTNPSPLCLIITAHESLKKLHEEIKEKNPHSTSPFLNFMDVGEITLGALSESDINIELKKLKLSEDAQKLIKSKVGQHPYLINIAYIRLKEAELVQETDPIKITTQYFKKVSQGLLDDMFSNWSSKMCQVFVQIAEGNFNNLNDNYKLELEELEKQGLIQQLDKDNCQWQVFSPVFIELLKEQDTSKLCPEKTK
jgi:hypothetical protein